jgi:hypothetical protein
MKVKKSVENQLFIDYMAFLTSKRKESSAISDEQKIITDKIFLIYDLYQFLGFFY